MNTQRPFASLKADLPAAVVVFFVALPLCLGIALASGAPLLSGVIAGIVGGIVVGSLSGSPLGVSGPAAGLAVIVLTAIQDLGSFDVFLVAVILAGLIQVVLGFVRAGFIAYYFPSSVITGMLSGIGIIIFLKQIPHALGYHNAPEGDMSFSHGDGETTFSGLAAALDLASLGPLIIAATSLTILILWQTRAFKNNKILSLVPGPLVAVATGVLLSYLFRSVHGLTLAADQFVSMPVADGLSGLADLITFPDFSGLATGAVYTTAIVIAVVASLETLLCVEATDKLDTAKRVTPTNRELKAQGVGNMISGFLGGIPVTQVIVRSSANIQAGGQSKASAVIHGVLLLVSLAALPTVMNMIPLATLAAILLMVGYKLATPALFKRMFGEGPGQFIPFAATIAGIVFTDLLVGVGIGLAIAIASLLRENFQLPFAISQTPHKQGERVEIVLAQHVSFLNKATMLQSLSTIPKNSSVVIDGRGSVYVHADVIEIIENFVVRAEEDDIDVVIKGLDHHQKGHPGGGADITVTLPPETTQQKGSPMKTQTKDAQDALTPAGALQLLQQGNDRFQANLKANRNLLEQVNTTADGQYPFAVILSCIDSRTSAELIFDQGMGDIFSIRIAGNVLNDDILGSMEFSCQLAGSMLIVVLGHSSCGAVKGACDGAELGHLTGLLDKLRPSVEHVRRGGELPREELVQQVADHNVERVAHQICERSSVLRDMIEEGKVGIVGAMYSVKSGRVQFHDLHCGADASFAVGGAAGASGEHAAHSSSTAASRSSSLSTSPAS